jgi:uncharacterized protein
MIMKSRRSFHQLTLRQGAWLAAPWSAMAHGGPLDPSQEWLIGGGQFSVAAASSSAPVVQRRAISIVSLSSGEPQLIDLDFFPHGFALDPKRPSRVASFQKIGVGAALVDVADRQVLRNIAPKGQQLFYGHGAFTPDGKWLLSTERDESKQRGLIGVRDANSLDYLGEFPSFGDNPHDCHLIDNGKVLLVANGDGSVVYIDLKTQKLLEKLLISNQKLNAGHVLSLPRRRLVTVSAPAKGLGEQDLGGISVRLDKQPWRSLTEPAALMSQLRGEALSVAVSLPHKVFAVTHPTANLVTIWSLEHARAVHYLSLSRPRGIETTVDGSKFLISYGQHAGLAVIDAQTLKTINLGETTTYFSGSHMVNWSRLKQLL